MSRPASNGIVSVVADCLAAHRKLTRAVAAPWLRLWRLASLRSLVDGHVPVSTQFDGPVHATRGARLSMGDRCRLGRGVFFETEGAGSIRVGSHVRINLGCVIVAHAGIGIGDDCLIGEYVSIRDAGHGTEPGTRMRSQPHTTAAISIEEDVWIGRGAVILKGVTIGRGAVVGANSVVTRSVPPMAIVGGVPAALIRMRQSAADRPAPAMS